MLSYPVAAAVILATASAPAAAQVIRSGVELVAVDVQVVDRDGHPIDARRSS